MQSNTSLFESNKINSSLLKLATPSVIAMISTAFAQIITSVFAGITKSNSLLAMAGLVFPVFTGINAVGQMVGVGSAASGGKKLGQNDNKGFSGIAAFSIIIAVILAVLISVLGIVFLKPLCNFLGATKDTLGYTKTYLKVLFLGAIFPILNMVFNNLLRALGKVVHSMNSMLIAAVLNIGLDALFLFVFKLKALGLGLAIVISQASAVLYSVIYFLTAKQISFKEVKNIKILTVLKDIFAVGLPTFLMQLFSSISIGILNAKAAKISTSAVSGFGIGNKIYMLIFQTILGYTQAFLPFCAYNYGKTNQKSLNKGLKFSIILTCSIALFFTIILCFFSNNISNIFSANKNVIKNASLSLILHAIPLVLVAFLQTLTVFYQGIKRTIIAGIISLSRQGAFLIPLAIIIPNIFKNSFLAISLVQPIADTLCFILTLILFIKFKTKIDNN